MGFDFSDTDDPIVPDEIRHDPFRRVSLPQAVAASGTMGMNLTPNGIAALLKSAWRAGNAHVVSSAYTGGGYSHAYTPGRVSPTFTFEASAADILMRRYGGIRVNTLEIAANWNEIVQGNFGLEGTTRGTTGSPATPTYDGADPFHFTGVSIQSDSVDLDYITSFSFTTGNNLDRRGALRKTRNWRRTALGLMDVGLSATIDFDSATEHAKFLAGTEFAVKLHLEAGIAAGAVKHTLEILLPRVKWTASGIPLSTADFIEQSVTATVLGPRGSTAPPFTATLVNTEATVVGG
jgi:hypothetical protein